MKEDYITGVEFFLLLLVGALLPWIIATFIQTRIYFRHGISKWHALSSALIMLLLNSALGVFLWAAVPALTITWQLLVLSIPSAVVNTFSFVPFGPMVASTLLTTVPVTYIFVRRYGKA